MNLFLLRRVPALLLPLALGCVAPDAKDAAVADSGADDTAGADTDTTGDTDDSDTTVPDGLNGSEPAEPVALPTFAARNEHGEARSEADLLGHPTVLWFYPAAGTYG